ncbi:MAG TPA: hypothetical protein VF472_11115 [Burkholderiaceae bacterium]
MAAAGNEAAIWPADDEALALTASIAMDGAEPSGRKGYAVSPWAEPACLDVDEYPDRRCGARNKRQETKGEKENTPKNGDKEFCKPQWG